MTVFEQIAYYPYIHFTFRWL